MGATGTSRAAALLSLAALGLLVVPQQAGADEQDVDAAGSSFASGVDGYIDTKPGLLIIPDVVHAAAPYTTSTFTTSGASTARAASYYPGQGPLSASALVCAATPICSTVSPPDYPLIAEAAYPAKPDTKATASGDPQTVGPLSTTPAVVTAHAGVGDVKATVVSSGTSVMGIGADQIRSTTSQVLDKGRLLLRSEVILTGVGVPGGLHVDQVRSVVDVDVHLDKVSTGKALTTVSGASIGGVPVTIGPRGISVNGTGDGGAAGAAAQDALAQLASAGVTARVLPPTATLATGRGAASTGGLLVTYERDVAGVPPLPGGPPSPNRTYVGSFTMGAAGVTGVAARGATFTVPVDDVTGGVVPPVVGTSGGTPSLGGLTAGGPNSGRPTLDEAPDSPITASPTTSGGAALASGGTQVLPQGSLRRLALLLLLYPLFVVASAVRRSPARFPGLARAA